MDNELTSEQECADGSGGWQFTLRRGRRVTNWVIDHRMDQGELLETLADILDAADFFDRSKNVVEMDTAGTPTVSAYEPLPVTQGVSWNAASGENPAMEGLPIF